MCTVPPARRHNNNGTHASIGESMEFRLVLCLCVVGRQSGKVLLFVSREEGETAANSPGQGKGRARSVRPLGLPTTTYHLCKFYISNNDIKLSCMQLTYMRREEGISVCCCLYVTSAGSAVEVISNQALVLADYIQGRMLRRRAEKTDENANKRDKRQQNLCRRSLTTTSKAMVSNKRGLDSRRSILLYFASC